MGLTARLASWWLHDKQLHATACEPAFFHDNRYVVRKKLLGRLNIDWNQARFWVEVPSDVLIRVRVGIGELGGGARQENDVQSKVKVMMDKVKASVPVP